MLSVPYQSKKAAKKAAKKYAQTHGLTKFNLLIDAEKKLFHFADIDLAPEPKSLYSLYSSLLKGNGVIKPL